MPKTSRAVFPGSFDPLTLGHVDIVTRTLQIFDEIIIGVLSNTDKESLFSVEERVRLIEAEFTDLGDAVRVESFSGLLVDFAEKVGTRVIVRGLRAISDFDYEAQMALMNRALQPDIETFFLMTSEKYSYVSSTLVKQVAPFGGSVSHLVPKGIERALADRFRDRVGNT